MTSIIILLPMTAGIILWDKLPERIGIHFNFSNTADNFADKTFTVFIIPLIMLAFQWLCIFVSSFDKQNNSANQKVQNLVLWICPAVSVFSAILIYPTALGTDTDKNLIGMIFVGFMYVVIGNYLPKCKQNHTFGIKIPWTLSDEENWNSTHRMSGILWIVNGFIILADAFLKVYEIPVMFTVIVISVAVPTLYSYLFYRKHI